MVGAIGSPVDYKLQVEGQSEAMLHRVYWTAFWSQSVAHMPMKAMIYKTLSTVVDDLFA